LDSSVRHEVRLHRRVARRIDVPRLQVACITHVIGRSIRSIGSWGASWKIGPNSLHQEGINSTAQQNKNQWLKNVLVLDDCLPTWSFWRSGYVFIPSSRTPLRV
jgi:hypothetical protein